MQASQVFFRNINTHDIKLVEQFPSGVYRMRGRMPQESALLENGNEENEQYPAVFKMREDGWSTLCLMKRGYNILEAKAEKGFLINCMPEGTIISEHGEIGRLQITESAFSSKDGNELNGWITDTISTIRENIRTMKSE